MKRLARVPLLAMLALLLFTGPPASAQPSHPYLPGELLIKYRPNAQAAEKAQLRASVNARFLREFDFIRVEHVKLERGETVERAIAKLRNHPLIEYAEPNYELRADVLPNDTRFNDLWGMRNTGQTGGTAGADIKAYNAWDLFTGDPNLKIGVIDTGVDYNHPDLVNNVWTNPGEVPGNGVDDDGNGYVDDVHGYDFYNNDGDPMDDNGHGSHVSGTIAGQGNNSLGVVGVVWSAKIVGIKFLSGGGSGSTTGAIAGVQYAIAVGVRLTSNSWGGGGFSQALLDAINAAGAQGQLFVAAAGNSSANTDTNPHYPSSYNTPYIIAVAATDHNDNLASFSNYGATTVDIAAPGVNTLSCVPGGGYQSLSGTSMATPHVSGVVALTWGRYPALSNLQVKTMIMTAADVKAQLAGKCVTGGRLNAFMTIAEPDDTPPGAVADLATTNPGSNTMGLAWTSTGDDGNTGRASRYEIRYSTSPITDASWPAATLVPGPDPLVAGSPQTAEVGGLAFNTLYYFAIKAFDEFSNAGPISNLATGTTLGIPNIAHAPGSFSSTLLTGGIENHVLTLSNTGEGTLDFTIPTPEVQFSQPVVFEYQPAPKGQPDLRTGPPVTENRGGPDGYGYRWIDSNEPGGPGYSWVDITGVGTPVALTGDDATSAAIPIGFDFPFYDGSFSSVRVCTNGFLSFTDASTAYENQGLPNGSAPANLVAPMWDDLDFGTSQRAYTHFDGARFIVSWVGVPKYGGGGPYTFQAILHPTGEILFQYENVGAPVNEATAGIQNAAKNVGLTVAYNTAYLASNLAVRIAPLAQWLTVTPTSGRIVAGASQELQVRLNALGLMGGSYTGTVRVLSNDPDQGQLDLPAALQVIGAPDLAVNPAALDFGTFFAGATVNRTLTVSNPGTDELQITSITTPDAAVTVDLGAFVLAPRAARNVIVSWHPTAPAVLSGNLSIASSDPDTPVKTVPLSGEAIPAPSFAVDPEQLAVTLLTNTATTRTLRVSNSGGSNYVFTAEPLVVTPSGSVTVYTEADNVDVPKGEPDTQFGPEPLRAGGPDVFGYTYQDSDEPTGPAFSWVDVRGVGTQIPLTGDDANSGPYPIGFDFPFYGKTFNSFRICTNGWVSFTSNKTALSNTRLPNSASTTPENLLAVYWDDMHFQTTPKAYYHFDGTKLVIQYQDVPRYGDYTHPNTFEILIYPNGTIVYQYLSMTLTTRNSATIGIQNEAKNDGLEVLYNAAGYIKDNLAIRFRPPARFLTVSPTAGTVPPGGYQDLTVGFNASGLFGGDYDGVVRIRGNDPVLPQKDVPARLTVTGVPDLALAPASLDFGTVFIGFPRILQFSVRNTGTDALVVSDITSSQAVYGVSPTSFTVPPLGTAVVDVALNPTAVGPVPALLSIASNDPDTPVATLPLTGEGVVAPDVASDPTSLTATVNVPGSVTQNLRLQNLGGSDLDFTVGTLITAVAVPQYEGMELGKEETDPRQGILGSGGPDVFGYLWRDSDDAAGPAFDWIDITTIGTPLALTGDDRNLAGVPIGFDFPFYGNTFSTVNVCTNGWLSFSNTTTDLSNDPLPSTAAPENLLAVFWDDLNPGTTQRVYAHGDATRFVVSYIAVPRYSSGGPYTFQVVLYPNGTIRYQYLDMQGTRLNEATVGIQNAAKNDGLNVVYNNAYMHNGLAVEFSVMPDYMTVTPNAGTIPAGGWVDLDVTFDTQGLFGGVYLGKVRVQSNDPDEPSYLVPTSLTAIGTPDVAAVPASVDFGWQYTGLTVDRTVTVRNVGSDALVLSGLAVDGAPYSLVGGPSFPLTLGDHGSVVLTLRFAPTEACDPCTGVLHVLSNDPDSPDYAVALTGVGRIPPEIEVAPTALAAALATTLGPTAITTTKQVVIANTGGSDLTYEATAITGPLPLQTYGYLELPKQSDEEGGAGAAEDPRQGILGSGGPDAFGYKWADSDEPGGPAYDWVDISGIGTPVGFPSYRDDGNVGPHPIGFAFPYYGSTFTQFRVCSNGWLSFTSSSTTYSNQPLPNSAAAVPENLLAVFWDDMVYDESDGSYVVYHNDGTRLIVEYYVRRIAQSAPPYYKFQIILYPNGDIVYQYNTLGTTKNSCTVGIQNGSKDDGLTVVFNGSYLHDNLAVRFSTTPPWLSVAPLSGTIAAGERDTLAVTFDATGLADGDYDGQIRITSNDLDEPLSVVDAHLHVGVAAATFDLDPGALNRSSGGNWVTGLVTPPGGVPQEIRTSSVLLQRTVPVAPGAPVSYLGPTAYYKFNRLELSSLLPVGNSVPVEVIGEVTDVTWFADWDTIRVLKPRMTATTLPDYGSGLSPEFQTGTVLSLAWADEDGFPATSYDLWFSADAGQTWSEVVTGLTTRAYEWQVPEVVTEDALLELVANDELGVMGSWVSTLFGVMYGTTDVNADIPTHFDLALAGANPTRGATRFELALPVKSDVDVRIYDVRGRLVTTLARGTMEPGRYTLQWDGLAGAGVYFLQANAGTFSKNTRFVLVK